MKVSKYLPFNPSIGAFPSKTSLREIFLKKYWYLEVVQSWSLKLTWAVLINRLQFSDKRTTNTCKCSKKTQTCCELCSFHSACCCFVVPNQSDTSQCSCVIFRVFFFVNLITEVDFRHNLAIAWLGFLMIVIIAILGRGWNENWRVLAINNVSLKLFSWEKIWPTFYF